jgi:hypothetical protein
MPLHTCVSPEGRFLFGIHKPAFKVPNQREGDFVADLGRQADGRPLANQGNFPAGEVTVAETAWIFEIANPFAFRGTTYIKKDWADQRAADPAAIRLPPRPEVSLSASLGKIIGSDDPARLARAFRELPPPILLAGATTSTDPDDLVRLARIACPFVDDQQGEPLGLLYKTGRDGRPRPIISDPPLFEAVANNPCLPERYKISMVLRPGAQGNSEIVGEFRPPAQASHVFEYLRRNSYIAGGHYAANMADDAVRYSVSELTLVDMTGLRHLYYQRTFLRLADQLGLAAPPPRRCLSGATLEKLRRAISSRLKDLPAVSLPFNATLWGWNYGFDFAPSHYRLNASHQQIHQQFAMIPAAITAGEGGWRPAYACGDLVADCVSRFRAETGRDFFTAYLAAIQANSRIDGNKTGPASLIIHRDENVILFVPKAQTSQWELQLLCRQQVGNIVEADEATRASLDLALLVAMRTLDALGIRMVTTIEFAKRIGAPDQDQRLLYSFLPKLPESPGAFSEAQLRWINGHYPEDFAEACRQALGRVQY